MQQLSPRVCVREPVQSFYSCTPVSYTHLDVYKRQLLCAIVVVGEKRNSVRGQSPYDVHRNLRARFKHLSIHIVLSYLFHIGF